MKTRNNLLILSLIINLVLILLLAGCSSSVPLATPPITLTLPVTPTPSSTVSPIPKLSGDLNLAAASSLTAALKEINTLYTTINPKVNIIPNFTGSGTLQIQIQNGAPTDVFLPAAEAQMDALQSQNLLLIGSRKDLLNNTEVLIVPNDSTLNITGFADLAIAKVSKIAIGDPKSVPAGTYAQQVFEELGITSQVQSKEVLAANVSQVLTYVEGGNVDAGIVYLTDALTSTKVKIVANAPSEVNAKILYPVAVIKASKNLDIALDYENFLFGSQAMAVFQKYGFTVIWK